MYWKDGATKMEENMTKFNEKMATLLELAAKNNNTLKYDEILSEFPEASMDGELFDKILEELEKTRVEILAAIDNEQEPVLLEVDEIDEADLEEELSNMDISKLDLSIPDGIGLDDPVRMYLKEIGKVLETHTLLSSLDSIRSSEGACD